MADRHPNATIWVTGHSLGGALASLVGQTFLVPTVTYEIPGEQLAARRLHLPHAPGVELPLWHFGHTADPIFVGACKVGQRIALFSFIIHQANLYYAGSF